MINYIKEFFLFCKNPTLVFSIQNKKTKLNRFCYSILTYLIIAIILGLFLVMYNKLLKHILNIDFIDIRNKKVAKTTGKSFISIILLVGIIGPIIEEILFRSWLTSKKVYFSFFLFVLSWIIYTYIIGYRFYSQKIDLNFYLRIITCMLIGLSAYIFIPTKSWAFFFNKYYKYGFYISAISFGLLHVTNFFPLGVSRFFICLPFILPQLLLGFILGFIRIKNGLLWSICLHIIINLISVLAIIHK